MDKAINLNDLLINFHESSDKVFTINKKIKVQINEISKTKLLLDKCHNCLSLQNDMLNKLEIEKQKVLVSNNELVTCPERSVTLVEDKKAISDGLGVKEKSDSTKKKLLNHLIMPRETNSNSIIELIKSGEENKIIFEKVQMNEKSGTNKEKKMGEKSVTSIVESQRSQVERIGNMDVSKDYYMKLACRFRTERDDEKARHQLTNHRLLKVEDEIKVLKSQTISPQRHKRALEELSAVKQKCKAAVQQRDDTQVELSKTKTALASLEQLVTSHGGLPEIAQIMTKKRRKSMNSYQRRKFKAAKFAGNLQKTLERAGYENYTVPDIPVPSSSSNNSRLLKKTPVKYVAAYAIPRKAANSALLPSYSIFKDRDY